MKFIFSALFFVVFLGLVVTKNETDNRVKKRDSQEMAVYLPSPKLAKILAFGFDQALADIYWIEAINYFGQQLAHKNRDYKYLRSYLDIILELDPFFTAFYDWAATVFIYNGLPISRSSIIQAIEFANAGVIRLNSVGRYDSTLIRKAAFNYALEAQIFSPSIGYFELGGRSFRDERDLLLVSSTYASFDGKSEKSASLKSEFLGYKAFEAQSREQIQEALQILSSPGFNSEAANVIQTLRLESERDEEVKKLIEQRLKNHPLLDTAFKQNNEFRVNEKILNVLRVDISKNWLPPSLHLLFHL
jgi:hypothetical protein